jgi:hypothetical protein
MIGAYLTASGELGTHEVLREADHGSGSRKTTTNGVHRKGD